MTNEAACRVKSIHARKLFGVYDHDVVLNADERITIIHGPNGVGKTALLRLTNALLRGNYLAFLTTPLEQFEILFFDGSSLRAVRSGKISKAGKSNNLHIERIKVGQTLTIWSIKDAEKSIERVLRHARKSPYLDEIGSGRWRDTRTQSKLTTNEVLVQYADDDAIVSMVSPDYIDYLDSGFNDLGFIDEPGAGKRSKFPATAFTSFLKVHLIEAQRLISLRSTSRSVLPSMSGEQEMFETVEQYSTELLTALRDVQSKFAAVTQKLDQSFPMRVLKQTANVHAEELEVSQKKISAKRRKLVSLGLMAKTADQNVEIVDSEFEMLTPEKLGTLALFLDDSAEKLKTFDDLADRVEILLDTINKKFINKEIKISGERGLYAIGPDGQDLALKSLSSGEQHEIILLYDMLFKVQKDSLVLLDEPELSLHLEWQRSFLDDLMRVIKVVGFDVIIATHSPYIVGDRSDLLVDLSPTVAVAA
jgi:predicted ATP-binding protein involved in virulence